MSDPSKSDVSPARGWAIKLIEKHFKYMCFPIVSGKRGIASCVYMENVHPIRKLSKFVKDEISQNPLTTDMLIIDRFYKLNQDSLMLFPTANPSIGHYNKLADEHFIRKVNSSFSQLQGVIDGHDLGVNYLGTDPRNARGIKYFFRPIEGTFIDINKVKLRYNKNRKFVDISSPNSIEYFPVYALHATSKALLLFNRHSRRMMRFLGYDDCTVFICRDIDTDSADRFRVPRVPDYRADSPDNCTGCGRLPCPNRHTGSRSPRLRWPALRTRLDGQICLR